MEKTKKIKLFIGISYLVLLSVFLFLFFSKFSLQEIMSYNFIKDNRNYLFEIKNSNMYLILSIYLILTILWVFPFLDLLPHRSSWRIYFWEMGWNHCCSFRFKYRCNIFIYVW